METLGSHCLYFSILQEVRVCVTELTHVTTSATSMMKWKTGSLHDVERRSKIDFCAKLLEPGADQSPHNKQAKSAWLRFCGRNRQLLRPVRATEPHCITCIKSVRLARRSCAEGCNPVRQTHPSALPELSELLSRAAAGARFLHSPGAAAR